jgi:hypothetical protein
MKTIFMAILFISVFPLYMCGQFTHAGIAGGYGTNVKEPGLGLFGMYTINEQIKIVPNIMYYLPNEITTNEGTQTFSWLIFNLDGEYVIIDQGAFQAYGLMGLGLISLRGEQDEPPFEDTKYLYKMGLNVGAGIRLPVSGKLSPFAEVKMILGDKAYYTFREVSTTQLVITAGILIRIASDRIREVEEF